MQDAGPPADPVAVAREIALRQLTTRARSRAELQKALDGKGVPAEAASEVLDRLTEVGLVDDAGFAEQWAQSRQRSGRSTRVIRQELRTKGLDAYAIDDALGGLSTESDYEAALALARKKAPAMASLAREVRYRRLAGALARRGFPSGVVHRVLAEVTGEGASTDD